MNFEDFETYRTSSLSYTLPSISEVKTYPYIVVKDGIYGRGFSSLSGFDEGIYERQKTVLISLIKKLYQLESEKEENFLKMYLKKIQQEDEEFYNQIHFLVEEKNFSQLFTLIKLREKNLINTKNNLSQELKKYSETWANYQNRKFMDTLRKAFTDGRGRYSVENTANATKEVLNQPFDVVFQKARDNFIHDLEPIAEQGLRESLIATWDLFEQSMRKHLDSLYISSLNDYKNKLKKENKIKSSKTVITKTGKESHRFKTVNQLVANLISPLNGMSAELFLVAGGATQTGKVKTNYGSLTGRKNSVGNIQTDDLQLYSETLEINTRFQEECEKILNSESDNIYEQLEKLINFYSQDNFIIHYSSKDLFQYSTKKEATIRDSASFDNRLVELNNIANEVGVDRSNIQNLIFLICNTGKGMVAEGENESLKDDLALLCASWMFEDYKETFSQIKTNKSNNRLHCYFINGKFYLLSDILQTVLTQIQDAAPTKLVRTSITSPKSNIYGEIKKEGTLQGIKRWEGVRERTLSQGKISIRLDTRILENILMQL